MTETQTRPAGSGKLDHEASMRQATPWFKKTWVKVVAAVAVIAVVVLIVVDATTSGASKPKPFEVYPQTSAARFTITNDDGSVVCSGDLRHPELPFGGTVSNKGVQITTTLKGKDVTVHFSGVPPIQAVIVNGNQPGALPDSLNGVRDMHFSAENYRVGNQPVQAISSIVLCASAT